MQIFKSFIAQVLNLSGFYTFVLVLNLTGFSKIYDSKPTALSFCVSADVGMQIFKSFIAQVLNLTGFSKIYDSKPTALSFCVSADVGMQIFNASGVEKPPKKTPKEFKSITRDAVLGQELKEDTTLKELKSKR
jgi:hypothetical protein